MPTIALRSRTLIPMRPVKSMLGLVTKQMCDHMLQQCDDSCIVFLCIDIKATRRAGGGDAAIHNTCMQTQQQQQQPQQRLSTGCQLQPK